MSSSTISFILKDRIVEIKNPDPNETLLNYIRVKLKKTGTKEGCAEGGCGACTVVLGELKNNKLNYTTVNSCITFLPTLQGKQLIVVEDLASKDGFLLNLDYETGKVIWSKSLYKSSDKLKEKKIGYIRSLLLASNQVLATTSKGFFLFIDYKNGKILSYTRASKAGFCTIDSWLILTTEMSFFGVKVTADKSPAEATELPPVSAIQDDETPENTGNFKSFIPP